MASTTVKWWWLLIIIWPIWLVLDEINFIWLGLAILLLIGYLKIKLLPIRVFLLGCLVMVNLNWHGLLSWSVDNGFSFNLEKMYVVDPKLNLIIERYWNEGLVLPYRLRNIFYSDWLTIIPWIGSVLKIWSPVFLVRLIGFSGFYLMVLGIQKVKLIQIKIYGWLFFVISLSSALSVDLETRRALLLAMPLFVFLAKEGFESQKLKKIGLLVLIILDLVLR